MAAEVSDLSCDSQEAVPNVVGWRQIREWFHDFVADYFQDNFGQRTADPPNINQEYQQRPAYTIPGHPPTTVGAPEVANSVAARNLAPFSEQLPQGSRCYLGMTMLAMFNIYLHDPEVRLDYWQTSAMGGSSFKKLMPLSYWDILNSGWPLFSLLEILSHVARIEAARGLPQPTGPGSSGLMMDMTPDKTDAPLVDWDREFLQILAKNEISNFVQPLVYLLVRRSSKR